MNRPERRHFLIKDYRMGHQSILLCFLLFCFGYGAIFLRRSHCGLERHAIQSLVPTCLFWLAVVFLTAWLLQKKKNGIELQLSVMFARALDETETKRNQSHSSENGVEWHLWSSRRGVAKQYPSKWSISSSMLLLRRPKEMATQDVCC